MAKIRVAQIKDLFLTPESGTQTLTVGANTITPLDEIDMTVTPGTVTTTDGLSVLTGLTSNGNTITPEYKTIASILGTLTGSATIATVADGVVTLKAGVSEANGIISNSDTTGATDIRLAKVATTGAAADVSVADAGNLITATTVEGALAEIAKEIDDMDSSLATTAESQADKLIKLGYTQVDGVITSLTSDESALETRLQNIENNTISGQEAIVVTPDATNGNNTVSLLINSDDTVLSQDDDGLKTNISLRYVSVADETGNGTHKVIQLVGTNGETPAVLGTVDATDFVKDSFLESATIVSGTWTSSEGTETFTPGTGTQKAIELVWKVITRDGDTSDDTTQTTYINVESLIDAYTAGNAWIEIDSTNNKISHKTVENLDSTNTHGITANVTVNSTSSTSFNVPSLKVDAAGHVVSVDEKQVTISLPTSIDTAVQTINGHEENATFITTTVTPSDDNKTQDIAVTAKIGTFSNEDEGLVDGLATTTAVEDYVEDYVANHAATQMIREALELSGTTTSLSFVPEGNVAITQNGIDLNPGEYTVAEGGTEVTFTIEEDVDIDADDVFVAYYMYNPNTQPQQNS